MLLNDFYTTHAAEYAEYTKQVDLSTVYRLYLKDLPAGSKILDCGCGSGRDTLAFGKMGYHVTAMDGSQELCKLAEDFTKQKVLHKTFDQIDWFEEFDGIWACASLLHLKKEQLLQVIPRLLKALKSKGILYASFKHGTGERLDDKGRFFTDYTPDQVMQLFTDGGFIDLNLWLSKSQDPHKLHEEWVNVICKKFNYNGKA